MGQWPVQNCRLTQPCQATATRPKDGPLAHPTIMPQQTANDLLTPEATGSRRGWVIAGLAIVVTSLGLAGYAAYQGQQALVRSHNLVLGRVVTGMVKKYVEKNEGQWPRSWHDVATINPGEPFNGPGSVETMQTQLIIDFQADPARLAQQLPEEFVAIRPRGAAMDAAYLDHWQIQSLLETLRKFHPTADQQPEK